MKKIQYFLHYHGNHTVQWRNNHLHLRFSRWESDGLQLTIETSYLTHKFARALEDLNQEIKLKDEEHAKKMIEMKKIIEKKNYESHYPIPEKLLKHMTENKKSFNIQILGCRGAGKSTVVNKLLRRAGIESMAETGCNETTKKTAFYDITTEIIRKPERYDKVFLCDQPGIGGLEMTETSYLAKFGPGNTITS